MEPPKGLGVEQAVQGPSSQALGAVPFTVYVGPSEDYVAATGLTRFGIDRLRCKNRAWVWLDG